jgi:5-methyltetrahydrofolate--homocysteine methyltransferase
MWLGYPYNRVKFLYIIHGTCIDVGKMSVKEELIKRLKEAVVSGDPEEVSKIARKIIEAGIDPLEAVEKALVAGVLELGDMWVRGEAFIADVVAAADAMKAGLSILKNDIAKKGKSVKYLGRIVIGTVEGDIHDIGKSIVATLWEASGFEVIDLGVDVSPQRFVEAIKSYNPDVVGMSALLTTSMLKQKETIEAYNIIEQFAEKYLGKGGVLAKELTKFVRAELEKRTNTILSRLGLREITINEDFEIFIKIGSDVVPLDNASGGERVAIAIAMRLALAELAMGRTPTVLILDEPTVYLDDERRVEIFSILGELGKSLKQVIIVTHDEKVIDIADAVIRVENIGNVSRVTRER